MTIKGRIRYDGLTTDGGSIASQRALSPLGANLLRDHHYLLINIRVGNNTSIKGIGESWLIVGPGRTGSKIIVDALRSFYRYNHVPHTYNTPDSDAVLAENCIRHSHRVPDFQLGYTRKILSTRNCVDSTFSWCIQPHIGKWHLYEHLHREQMTKINPFVLDIKLFLDQYHRVRKFYELSKQFIAASTLVLDYSEFCHNPQILYGKLGIPDPGPIDYMPRKNPGPYKNWIINWDEISEVIANLPTQPF